MVIVLVSMNVLAWTTAPWLQDDPRRNRQQRTTIPQQDDDKNRPERGERRDNGNRAGQKRDSIVAQPIIDIEDEEIPDSLLHPRWQIQRTQPVTQEDLNRSATDLSMPANIEQKVEYNDTLGGYLIGSKMGGRYLGAPVLMTAEGTAWKLRAEGEIEPNCKEFIEEFGREDLNDLEHLCVQLVAYKREKHFLLKSPVNAQVRVDTVKFYKLHAFRENDFFEQPALIYTLIENDVQKVKL